jgi:hypothetical protein
MDGQSVPFSQGLEVAANGYAMTFLGAVRHGYHKRFSLVSIYVALDLTLGSGQRQE